MFIDAFSCNLEKIWQFFKVQKWHKKYKKHFPFWLQHELPTAETNLYEQFVNTRLINFAYTRFLEELGEIWQFFEVQNWHKKLNYFFKPGCDMSLSYLQIK